MTETDARILKLLDPFEGIERGLTPQFHPDPDELISIRLGEILEVTGCLRAIASERELEVPTLAIKGSNR